MLAMRRGSSRGDWWAKSSSACGGGGGASRGASAAWLRRLAFEADPGAAAGKAEGEGGDREGEEDAEGSDQSQNGDDAGEREGGCKRRLEHAGRGAGARNEVAGDRK